MTSPLRGNEISTKDALPVGKVERCCVYPNCRLSRGSYRWGTNNNNSPGHTNYPPRDASSFSSPILGPQKITDLYLRPRRQPDGARAACTASTLSAYRRWTLRGARPLRCDRGRVREVRRRRGVPRRPRAIRVRRRISEGQEVSLVRRGRISERGWSATARAFSVRVGSRHDAARRRGRDQRLGSTCLTRRALFRPLGIGSPPSGGGRCLPPRPRSGPLAAMGCRLEVFARESPEFGGRLFGLANNARAVDL